MKTVILTEKPSVARDFAKSLRIPTNSKDYFEDESYIICWAIGHLLRPYDPEDYHGKFKKWRLSDLPILPERLLYLAEKNHQSHLMKIKEIISRADIERIIVATDAGREGELIARTILQYCQIKRPSYRFWTSEALTSEVISKNLNMLKPLERYDSLYVAGKARQFADWLVGMNLSRLATLKLGDLYSIGRVQTAVLGLLVDRRSEIDSFHSKNYWQVQLSIDLAPTLRVKSLWFDPDATAEEASRLSSIDKAEAIAVNLQDATVVLERMDKSSVEHLPPPLFSLTELQREANRLYGLTAQKTLEIAQKLYEKDKCLSYPRTDAEYLATSSFRLVQRILKEIELADPEQFSVVNRELISESNGRAFDDSKLTDHHAIIPLALCSSTNGDELKIYNLVVKRFLQVFCDPALSFDYQLIFSVNEQSFKSKERFWIRLGWKTLDREEVQVDQRFALLDQLPIQQQFKNYSAELLSKKTHPPVEYSESLLLRDMANPAKLVDDRELKKIFRTHVGLGTQSTRAQIIETLIKRNYIERRKRHLIAKEKGIALIKQLRQYNALSTMTYSEPTARWEMQLELISLGKYDGLTFINQIKQYVVDCVNGWR